MAAADGSRGASSDTDRIGFMPSWPSSGMIQTMATRITETGMASSAKA